METHWNLFSFLFLRVTTGRLPSKIKLSHLCARSCWSFFFQGKGREMPKGESRCDWAVRRSADWSGLGGGHFGKRSPSRVFRSGWVVELFSIQSDVSGAGASRWSPIARTFSGRRARAFNNSSTPPFCCRDESFFFLFDRNSCCSSWFAPFSNDIVPSVGEKRRKSHSDAIVVVCLRARGFVLSFLSQEGKRDKKKRREFFFFNKCVCVCECVSPAVRIKPR